MDSLPRDQFVGLVTRALDTLSPVRRRTMRDYNVVLAVGDASPSWLRVRHQCRLVYGSYEGPRKCEGPGAAGRRITLYRVDICQVVDDVDALTAWLPQVIVHEFRHFLGHDHADMGFVEAPRRTYGSRIYRPPSGFVIRNREVFDQYQRAEAETRTTRIERAPRVCESCGSIAERRTMGASDGTDVVGALDACPACEGDTWKWVVRGPAAERVRRLRAKYVI